MFLGFKFYVGCPKKTKKNLKFSYFIYKFNVLKSSKKIPCDHLLNFTTQTTLTSVTSVWLV